jgi:hypothetical protein
MLRLKFEANSAAHAGREFRLRLVAHRASVAARYRFRPDILLASARGHAVDVATTTALRRTAMSR